MKEIAKHAWSQLKGFHAFIMMSLALLIVGEIFGIYIPYLFGQIINKLGDKTDGVYILAFAAIGFLVSAHFAQWLREYVDLKKYFFTFNEKIEGYATRRLMGLSLGQHMNMNSSVINETIGMGVSSLKDFVISILFNLTPHIFYVVLSVSAITLVSWQMGLMISLLSAVYLWAALRFNKSYEVPLLALEEEHRKRGKFKSEMLRNVIPVKLGGQEEWFNDLYMGEISRVNTLARTLWLRYSSGSHMIGFLKIGITIAMLLFGVRLVKNGQESTGVLVMLFSWTASVTARLGSIRSEMRQVARQIPTIKKYIDLVSTEPDLDETGTKLEIKYGKINMSNVSYNYGAESGGGDRGIYNVSLEIEAGEMIGIVGESGAGKSTLIKLLTRAWDPTSGGIYIDNIPLEEFASSYRRQIAFVQQEGQLFDNTIRFNLTFGAYGELSDDVLWQALENTQMAKRVRQSKDGLDSLVGERGIKLSGGERQRLLMAQAIIRKAKILILDEATSHLDVKTEEGIFQNVIRKTSENATTIIVAHRFATLKSCSRIIVMDNGRLVAFDNHKELMRSCNIYRELVEKQNLIYTPN